MSCALEDCGVKTCPVCYWSRPGVTPVTWWIQAPREKPTRKQAA
jgi:hypothetical protein